MRGEAVDDAGIAREIAPCFVEKDGRRTDCVVLACTHFPLLIDALERLAPWPVAFVDPAPAIARRLDSLLGEAPRGSAPPRPGAAIFTSGAAARQAPAKSLASVRFDVYPLGGDQPGHGLSGQKSRPSGVAVDGPRGPASPKEPFSISRKGPRPCAHRSVSPFVLSIIAFRIT